MKNNNRMFYLDIARAIAIILMVCGHCDNWGSIANFVGLFHISCFMFISGYLFMDKDFIKFSEVFNYLKLKVWKLYKFYLKYEVLFFTLTNFFFLIGFYDQSVNYGAKFITPISSISQYMIGLIKIVLGMGREPFCGAFWYIISLIFVTIGYAIINYIANNQKIMSKNKLVNILTLLCFFIGCLMSEFMNIPRVGPSFTLMIIYHFGNLAYRYREKIKFNNFYFALLSVIMLFVLNKVGFISMNNNSFSNPLFFLTCSTCGIYFVLWLSKFIEKTYILLSSLLLHIGKNTLIIMAFHFIGFKVAMFLQLLFDKISYNNLAYLTGYNNNNGWYIIYVIMGVFFPLLLSYIYAILKSTFLDVKENINKG